MDLLDPATRQILALIISLTMVAVIGLVMLRYRRNRERERLKRHGNFR